MNIWPLFKDRLEKKWLYPLSFYSKTSHWGWAFEGYPSKSNIKSKGQTSCCSFSEQCMSFDHLPPLKTCPTMFRSTVMSSSSFNFLHNKLAQEEITWGSWCSHTQHAHEDAGTHTRIRTCTHAHTKDNHQGPLHTWPVYKNCAPQHACIHWGQGYSLEEESTVGQHVTMYNTVKQNKAAGAELSQG